MPVACGLGRRDFGASERRDVAHLIAAIDQCGRRRFPHDPDRLAFFIGAPVGRYGQDARQAREAVAAQGIVHQLVDDNRCILGGVANAPQRAFADGPRLGFRDADGLGAVPIQKFLPHAQCPSIRDGRFSVTEATRLATAHRTKRSSISDMGVPSL